MPVYVRLGQIRPGSVKLCRIKSGYLRITNFMSGCFGIGPVGLDKDRLIQVRLVYVWLGQVSAG
jgi:hypothetical protein